MAPEVLELHRNKTRAALNNIESYKRADIYSFGLVVWELCMGTYMGTSTPKELPKEVNKICNMNFEYSTYTLLAQISMPIFSQKKPPAFFD
jgi:hypothetical protein